MVFLLFSLTRILSLSCSCGRLGRLKLRVFEPPNAPKSTPKLLQNTRPHFVTLKVPNLPPFGALLGTPKSPQNWLPAPGGAPGRSWIAFWRRQFLLGIPSRSPHDHFGCSWARLDPPGGDFCSILVPPGLVLAPPRPNLAPLRGIF